MAIHRGIQSAVFFYLSCAPCAEARYRKKRKQEAAQIRAERELLEQEHPNLYHHPVPSSTNPYWGTEIALGPNLTARGKRRVHGGEKAGKLGANSSGEPSSVNLPDRSSDDRHDSKWNIRLQQREDEELWGSTHNLDGSASEGSIRRPEKARMRDPPASSSSNFQTFRNPPINHLHPPTVTKVTSREDVMWMMQPPPVAEVMSGRERVSRSRSGSGGSRTSPPSISLSRQVSNRIIQQKLRAEEGATAMSRQSSSRTTTAPVGPRSDWSAAIAERDFAINPAPRSLPRQPLRPSPIADDSRLEQPATTLPPRHSPGLEPLSRAHTRSIATLPQLSTTASDHDTDIADLPRPVSPSEISRGNQTPSLRHNHSHQDISRHRDQLLPRPAAANPKLFDEQQQQHPPIKIVHNVTPRGHFIRTTTAPELHEGGPRYPGHKHEDSEDVMLSFRPELFDSWYTPDFELPKWVHEHTKREVKQRWSMDL